MRSRQPCKGIAACLVVLWAFFLLATASPRRYISSVDGLLSAERVHAAAILPREGLHHNASLAVYGISNAKRDPTAGQVAYDAAVGRGCGRSAWMQTGVNPDVGPSQFTNYADLANNGWHVFGPSTAKQLPDDLASAYNGRGYSTDQASNPGFLIVNDAGGDYTLVVNPTDGVIIALFTRSPAQSDPPANPIPALNALSDVAFLQWQQLNGGQGITTFFRHHIASPNTNTGPVIDQVLETEGLTLQLGPWPGVLIDSTRQASLFALLGTAHATLPVYFLAQHRAQLGAKSIGSVNIFTTGADVNLAFNVVNA